MPVVIAAPVEVITPDVPDTPDVPEISEAPAETQENAESDIPAAAAADIEEASDSVSSEQAEEIIPAEAEDTNDTASENETISEESEVAVDAPAEVTESEADIQSEDEVADDVVTEPVLTCEDTAEEVQESAVEDEFSESEEIPEDYESVSVIAPDDEESAEDITDDIESSEAIESFEEKTADDEELTFEDETFSEESSEEALSYEDVAESSDPEPDEPEEIITEEDEDDVKVYIPPEKAAEPVDEEYGEGEYEEQEEITSVPSYIAVTAPPKRRNFETRISSELADPSAYSPGVAQDETLFIRKKRPEEATAVFSASTPGLAPDFDDDDFFEQWLEEGDDMIIKDKRQRRKVSALIGAVTMAFAIIGFIFVIVWFVKGIPTGSNSSGSQTDYAKFILPVVNADPEPFETITSVDNNILVEAAINRLTYGEAAADQTYTALEVENETRLLIPAADVEKSGKVLFGDTFTIDYTVMYAIEDERIYYYSAADNCFHVVTTSGDIEPEIIKISHIGSRTQVLLDVGYISATEEAMEGSEYYKQMEYVLNALDDGTYYVSAIRAIEN